MLDKIKALMDMQKKMSEVKKVLENTQFSVLSQDNSLKIIMNAAQEIIEVSLEKEVSRFDKSELEKDIKDTYNKAIKQAQSLAAEKAKEITGFNF